MKSFLTVFAMCIIVGNTGNAVAQNYINLLQDRSLQHWTLPDGKTVENGWVFDPDGALHLVGKGDNILTQCEYQNFDLCLTFEFRKKETAGSSIACRNTARHGWDLSIRFRTMRHFRISQQNTTLRHSTILLIVPTPFSNDAICL